MGNLRRSLLNNNKRLVKKSQAEGFVAWFFIIIVLLGIAIVLLVLNKAYGSIKPELDTGLNQALPDDSSVNVSKVLSQATGGVQIFDKLLPFLLIGLFGFVMIIAGSIMKHPIMIFVGIIVMGVVILLAVIYSNLYQSIAETEEFADTSSDLPIQSKFMQYLPFIVIVAAVGIIGALLWRGQGVSGL